jgi:hypothetical protein
VVGGAAEDDRKPGMVAEVRHTAWCPVTRAPRTPDSIAVMGNIDANPGLLSV